MASHRGHVAACRARGRRTLPSAGLFGKPTNINNVETYANVPWIINNGADGFRRHRHRELARAPRSSR